MKVLDGWKLAGPVAMCAGMAFALAGCGTPGAPLPPSLKLPDPVVDLAAIRTGNQVTLAWTMPKKTTDKLLIKGKVTARVCRRDGTGVCSPVAGELSFSPGTHAAFEETLKGPMAAGTPRPLTYTVELENGKGRCAGASNAAVVLAGQAPDGIAGLTAEVRKAGVVLRWAPDAGADASAGTVIRLHRTLLSTEPGNRSATRNGASAGILGAPHEPVEQDLVVEPDLRDGSMADRALDKTIRFGRTYEYRAQRVARVSADSASLELAGPLSNPIRVEAVDVFPPAVPTGLAAVATAPDSSLGASIDLSWQPVAEADVAGYAVYRREAHGAWQRLSPAEPVVGPGFHDPGVEPGHTYHYAVSAIDQGGHESARSTEADETVPRP